ncbi:MAG TPA: formate dehydrogenase [Eubacterium sp.]|jgi:NADH-quinone oxidoreductase subunit E|nr:formate dehydrogenase [Eubacterium sp.]
MNIPKEVTLEVIQKYGASNEQMLKILIELQRRSEKSYIDEETANIVADAIGISHNRMFEVLTFYAMLETKPKGKYIIEVCNNTPCYFNKSDAVMTTLIEELGIKPGETTYDGLFSLQFTPCVGACDIGPVIKIKDQVYGELTPDKIKEIIASYRKG